jgi:hypothetical protein
MFRFGPGPKVRLVKVDMERMQGIVVGIKSGAGKAVLTERGVPAV